MVQADNAAGRLYLILEQAREHSPAKKTSDVWREVLGVDEGNLPELLRALADVLALPNEIRRRVESLSDVDHDLYLKRLPPIEQGLLVGSLLSTDWRQVREYLTDDALSSLEYADDLLHRRAPDVQVSTDQVREWHDEIRSIFAELELSDLDQKASGT